MSLPSFIWLSRACRPPARWDLRLLAWTRAPAAGCRSVDGGVPCVLDWRAGERPRDWGEIRHPATVVVVGADDARDRTRLLDAGFGDAVGMNIALVELASRLIRLKAFARSMPRERRAGPLVLDLFYRDARAGDRWLGLHPREFALLWRLAETPFARLSRRELLADVWRMEHVPETNSLEVHVSRLRAKLAISHCAWLVRTHPDGGYQLGRPQAVRAAGSTRSDGAMLDRRVAIGNGVDAQELRGSKHAAE
ncbi:winged helix-turn-helix domain-containing protein [Qipengyuania sp. XHP0207]|uniref:winged helix-turn-helix domain-containing protein n=1 Tax=Qipengyuania sp. XHP0207 TaxID=3038078 RepID=UPI00241F32BA|nr:winged helix-turn-helix domain-containing protein [Qipengyuania sp. XHP0207]MDG5747640.1 winged helix-turn-helix domain-containing protein [Qipengyuania sp. XHP0207]